MIRDIRMDEVEHIAKYVYRLNQNPKHNCKSFPIDYEDILASFKRSISEDDRYLIGYFIDDRLEGVASLIATPKEKYVQTNGGIFAENNYNKVSKVIFNWIKDTFKGFYFYMAFSSQNKQAIDFCESENLTCSTRAYFLRITEKEFKYKLIKTRIEILTEKYYDIYKIT